jgi:UDP-N-acetylmuramate dehydrogenase
VVGNAGAHGGDIAGNLKSAEILQHTGRETWLVERMEFSYRSSILKRVGQDLHQGSRQPGHVVLSALLKLEHSTRDVVQARIDKLVAYRRQTQPPGASMGSMFKNPPGDYAGRLIEAAGLKGARMGEAQISDLHANFFVNRGMATAADIFRLLRLAQATVLEKFGIQLEPEIELVGDWAAYGQ